MRHASLRPALLAASLGLAACSGQNAPPAAQAAELPAAGDEAELVARGRYLVRIAGCNDCHTPGYAEKGGDVPEQAWLVGSPLGYHGPWGTTYAANLRLKLADMDEAAWLAYSAELHTRPIMPDYNVRAMTEGDRRALYHYVRSLGRAGEKAPDYLPPGQQPPLPYFQLVLPAPAPAPAPAE
jgi:mono/diheme cytochrome c family protein